MKWFNEKNPSPQQAGYVTSMGTLLFLPLLLIVQLLTSGCTPTLGKYHHHHEPVYYRPPVEQHFGTHAPHQPGPPAIAAEMKSRMTAPRFLSADSVPLSPGDRLLVTVQNGEHFSGLFEIDMDGDLKLPYLSPLRAYGHSTKELEKAMADALVREKMFRRSQVRVSIQVQLWAPVQVHVGGSVFNPGMVSANVRKPEEREQKQQRTGDYPIDRMLPAALRAAGGIRPDADLSRIKLIRDGESSYVDLSGLMSGYPVAPVALMSGDTIIVPGTGRFDATLVAPSSVTPPGIRVFLSSLTTPAPGNAQAAVERHATNLPYGSRLLTAAVSANCVGGTNATNGSRHVVLVRTDPISGREEAIKRPIDQLLLTPELNDVNPFMMPNDSVACYDSAVTNFRDVGRSFSDVLMPFTLLILLL